MKRSARLFKRKAGRFCCFAGTYGELVGYPSGNTSIRQEPAGAVPSAPHVFRLPFHSPCRSPLPFFGKPAPPNCGRLCSTRHCHARQSFPSPALSAFFCGTRENPQALLASKAKAPPPGCFCKDSETAWIWAEPFASAPFSQKRLHRPRHPSKSLPWYFHTQNCSGNVRRSLSRPMLFSKMRAETGNFSPINCADRIFTPGSPSLARSHAKPRLFMCASLPGAGSELLFFE